jgi:hypothetical protein
MTTGEGASASALASGRAFPSRQLERHRSMWQGVRAPRAEPLGEKEFNRLKERLEKGESEESRYPEPEPSYAKVADQRRKGVKRKAIRNREARFYRNTVTWEV